LIQPEQLAKFTGYPRRVDRALALSALVNVLKTAWPRIEGKTALTLTELEHADEAAVFPAYPAPTSKEGAPGPIPRSGTI
jgi:hypothetical protein